MRLWFYCQSLHKVSRFPSYPRTVLVDTLDRVITVGAMVIAQSSGLVSTSVSSARMRLALARECSLASEVLGQVFDIRA